MLLYLSMIMLLKK